MSGRGGSLPTLQASVARRYVFGTHLLPPGFGTRDGKLDRNVLEGDVKCGRLPQGVLGHDVICIVNG